LSAPTEIKMVDPTDEGTVAGTPNRLTFFVQVCVIYTVSLIFKTNTCSPDFK
jgi:hypothetical protein